MLRRREPLAGVSGMVGYDTLHVRGCSVTQATTSEGYIEGLPATRSCVRFRRLDDLALDVIGETIEANPDAFLARYVGVRGSSRRARSMGR